MTGPLFAATFSFGCEMANELGLTPMLEKYVSSGGKSCPEEEIRQALQKLASYFYYLVIAEANAVSDPFDLRVVRAHWIGNEFLEKVEKKHIAAVVSKEIKRRDSVLLAFYLKAAIKTGKAHHNFYAKETGNDGCRVTSDGEYLWHLGQKRILAQASDLENLAKYG